MTIITTQTRYKCNGCDYECVGPHNWKSLVHSNFGSGVFTTTTGYASSDYCPTCIGIMMEALRNQREKSNESSKP